MISLKHKKHGYHNVYTETDAQACEKNGWVRCDMEKEIQAAISAKNLTQEVKKDVLVDETAVEAPRKKRKYTKKVVSDDATTAS